MVGRINTDMMEVQETKNRGIVLLGTYCQPTLGAVSGSEGEVQCSYRPWGLLDERVGLAGA